MSEISAKFVHILKILKITIRSCRHFNFPFYFLHLCTSEFHIELNNGRSNTEESQKSSAVLIMDNVNI